jgi:long-chain acyl-CoA synthetase
MSQETAEPARNFPVMSVAEAHARLAEVNPLFEVEEAQVRGVRLKVWKNAPPTLREIFSLGQQHADKVYMVLDGDRVTFEAHRRAVLHLAAQLLADGVVKGDRVAVIMRNLPEWSVAFWAAALIGAVATPLNAWWTGPELEYGLQDSGAKVVFADPERWERIGPHVDACPDLQKIYVARVREEISDPRVARLEDVLTEVAAWGGLPSTEMPAADLQPDDDVTIFYTSGTTGKPKGAVISHRNIISNFINSASAQARAYLRKGEAPPQPDPEAPQRVFLVSVPLFHATGCFAIMIPAMMQAFRLVFQRRFEAGQALELMQRERVTHFGGVPTIVWQIIEHPRRAEFDLSSVETVSYGGAPSAPELVKRIREAFPKAAPGQGWGMTETSATAVSNFGEDYVLRPASCGVASVTGEAKIAGPQGCELARGEVGELWYKGPIVVRGYWNKPGPTAETFVDGWVKTGDLARMDEEGFIFIVDRAKDMLIRGGENIYCVEVENALYEHPAVMDAAVIGLPHRTLGEEPAAVVHLKPGQSADEAELRHWVAQRLAAFKVPARVAFWPDTLPRNANGKILKRDLKQAFSVETA